MSKLFNITRLPMEWIKDFYRIVHFVFFKFFLPYTPTKRELLLITFVTIGILHGPSFFLQFQSFNSNKDGQHMMTSPSDSLPLLINNTNASEAYEVINDDIDFLKHNLLKQQYKLNSCISQNKECAQRADLLEKDLTKLRKGYNEALEKQGATIKRIESLYKRLKQDNFFIPKSLVWNSLITFGSLAIATGLVIVSYKFVY